MIQATESQQADVIVIGGGPAGATVSTLISQHGYKVKLFERERFPRFHIGESLIPETYWVLERLKMLPKMKQSCFVRKYSVQFVNQRGMLSEPFYFDDHKPQDSSQTWQILRSEFDQMMLENAREQGVTAEEGIRVLEVLFEGGRAVGIRLQDEQGNERCEYAKVVVDASGQSALLMNRLGLKVPDTYLQQGAVWSYFEGAYRDKGKDEGCTVVLQTKGKQGWFWYIPLHNNIVSVGVVSKFALLFDGRSHEQIFNDQLENCPAVKERISIGKRVAEFRATKDYSYKSREVSGDGWVLIGDAFGFLDPLYSSGVLLALKSGQLAADAIVEGLKSGDTSKAQLGKWGPNFLVGMDRMRRLVCEYYEGLSFGRFIKKYPHTKGLITDLLIGDLFEDKVDSVFEHLDEFQKENEHQQTIMTDTQ